ncbi:MAG: RNA 2',3'-cyclic phosphodiesterase [Nitrospiraceae bacterium]|nr:RNA 2',3'-cyclic phosphodiesterase [Nitrospiraceae bacterium]
MALRCFIAAEIPEAVKKKIGETIQFLSRTNPDVRWVPEGNLHITLKFLGSAEESVVEAITDSLKKNIAPYTSFYIKIAGIGFFPAGGRPRVIWIGVKDGVFMEELRKAVDSAMSAFGFPADDRPFSPHLTIGRVRSGKGMLMLLTKIEELQGTDFGDIEIRGITVMKSELKPSGAEYSSLAEIGLKGRNNV